MLKESNLYVNRFKGRAGDLKEVFNSTREQVQCNAMQCNAMQCNAMQCNAMQCNAMQCNAIQYNTIQYNTIQYNSIQYNTSLKMSVIKCIQSIRPEHVQEKSTCTTQSKL